LDWPALIERLRARLGDEALHGLGAVADHRPARAWRERAPAASKTTKGSVAPAVACGARPFWLLHREIPLRQEPAQILAGPERIESGWWDGDDQRRDYYVVRTRQGQRAWAYVAAGATQGWMLHGWFA
ncbi:MAG: DNA polymerase Y family protein, partial [Dokdonella sp.]